MQITKTYSEEPIIAHDLYQREVKVPTVKAVWETYGNTGPYLKKASALKFGIEDDSKTKFWTINESAGRFEYRVDCLNEKEGLYHVSLSRTIQFSVFMPNKVLYRNELWLDCIEDYIALYYLDNVFTRDQYDMTYAFGCRLYKNELVTLRGY